jgi:uncharacterized protein
MQRADSEQWVGDQKKSAKSSTDTSSSAGTDSLFIASRCHQNFIENVPFALLLSAIVEMNGGNRKVLTGGLAALLFFRVVHAEFGLRGQDSKGNDGMGWGRPVGAFGTLGFVLSMGGYAGWLVKGYWGL